MKRMWGVKKVFSFMFLALMISVLLAACGGGGGGSSDGGNSNPPSPSNNATITGTVSGTTVKAFNLSGAEVASNTATGNPKTFSLNVPANGSYKFYLIENEGTSNERVYALYWGTTNVFNIASAVTIDLGFVDTSTGKAVPANNPLNVTGVTSGGESASIPTSLAGSAFSLADLQGTWNYHMLISGDSPAQTPGWQYGTFVIDGSGNSTATSVTRSNGNPTLESPSIFSITTSGIVTIADAPLFRGVLSQDKNTAVATNTNDGSYSIGYVLVIFQRSGGTFSQADLTGTWNWHVLKAGDGADTNGWEYGTAVIDGSGNVTVTCDAKSNGCSAQWSTVFTIDTTSGVVSQQGNPNSHGVMSQDKSMLVGTDGDVLDGYDLIILQKAGGTFAQSDLTGTWNYHQFWAGDPPGNNNGWAYGTAVIDGSGSTSLYCGAESDNSCNPYDPPLSRTLTITTSGVVSQTGSPNFHLMMSQDKSMFIGTDGGSNWFSMIIGIK